MRSISFASNMHFTLLWVTIVNKGKVECCNEENLRHLYPSYVNNNISWTPTVFTTILLIDDGIFIFCMLCVASIWVRHFSLSAELLPCKPYHKRSLKSLWICVWNARNEKLVPHSFSGNISLINNVIFMFGPVYTRILHF